MIKADITSRRNVLRGGLAAACGLLIPTALLGCKAKTNEPETSDAANQAAAREASNESANAVSNESTAPATTGKMAQDSVQYQAQPKGDLKCSDCMHFTADSSGCKLVEGSISPDGWCSLWSRNI
jgi:hypothetical protein